jgi:hypothetical protein
MNGSADLLNASTQEGTIFKLTQHYDLLLFLWYRKSKNMSGDRTFWTPCILSYLIDHVDRDEPELVPLIIQNCFGDLVTVGASLISYPALFSRLAATEFVPGGTRRHHPSKCSAADDTRIYAITHLPGVPRGLSTSHEIRGYPNRAIAGVSIPHVAVYLSVERRVDPQVWTAGTGMEIKASLCSMIDLSPISCPVAGRE